MRIYSLVGPSGCGKTTLLNEIASRNFTVLDERYKQSQPKKTSNRELLSKWNWISQWFERVLDLDDPDIVFTDRCPLEAAAYAQEGHLLLPPIRKSIEELSGHGVIVHTVYIRVPFDEIMERCRARMLHEPDRVQYGELDLEYARRTYEFYESLSWHLTVDADHGGASELADRIVSATTKAI